MTRALEVSFWRVWLTGLRMGLRTVFSEPILGLKRIILPSNYWRTAEFAYAWSRVRTVAPKNAFDLGSPKDLAAFIASDDEVEVVAADILPETIDLSKRYARAMGIEGRGAGRVHSETADGRNLTYATSSFDVAFSVSVLEHIPDGGDSLAMRELARIVRPGGRVVITVPYDTKYRETFVDGDVYERKSNVGERVFFERHYDEESLRSRLLETPGLRVIDLQIWGEPEGLRGEKLLLALGPIRTLLSPLEGLLAAICLRPTTESAVVKPMAAFVTFERTAA